MNDKILEILNEKYGLVLTDSGETNEKAQKMTEINKLRFQNITYKAAKSTFESWRMQQGLKSQIKRKVKDYDAEFSESKRTKLSGDIAILMSKFVSLSVSAVPVGLFGLQSQTTLVLSVIAFKIASESTAKSLFTGTFITFPPFKVVTFMYQPKDGSAYIASSPSSINAAPISEMSSKDPFPKMKLSSGAPSLSERLFLSVLTLKSG